jgi:hypothetical protein
MGDIRDVNIVVDVRDKWINEEQVGCQTVVDGNRGIKFRGYGKCIWATTGYLYSTRVHR